MSARPEIICIDDEPNITFLIRALLEEAGFQVRIFNQSINAVRFLGMEHVLNESVKSPPSQERPSPFKDAPPPALIISDFEMPGINGFEFLRCLRSQEHTRHIPVIMVSGTTRQVKELVLSENTFFLPKPFQAEELIQLARRAIRPPADAAAPSVPANAEPADALAPAAAPASKTEINFRTLVMRAGDVTDLLSDWADESKIDLGGTTEDDLRKDASPLIKIVDEILDDGIARGVSDIHFEPQENACLVRMRKDGVLQSIVKLPAYITQRVVARLKIMASLDIAEKRIPQDGRFSRKGRKNVAVDFRVSTLPAIYGEKVVLRLLKQDSDEMAMDHLGLSERDRQCFEAVLRTPQGLILVTGPTGSGKTTTLYAMINALNTDGRNILTVEDPVEYRIHGVNQVAVNTEAGLTFGKILRAFLRQDPNVILVGEMRDTETAEIGMQAAVTGHLVLSTLHTNSAPASVSRLITMGIKPYMIAASLRLIVAQRLVRLLCPACRAPAALLPDEAALLTAEERASLTNVFGAKGCKQCSMTGYAGRRPVCEVMPVETAEIRKAILEGGEEDILAQSKKEGMLQMRTAALAIVAQGLTSPSEAIKVLFSH